MNKTLKLRCKIHSQTLENISVSQFLKALGKGSLGCPLEGCAGIVRLAHSGKSRCVVCSNSDCRFGMMAHEFLRGINVKSKDPRWLKITKKWKRSDSQ